MGAGMNESDSDLGAPWELVVDHFVGRLAFAGVVGTVTVVLTDAGHDRAVRRGGDRPLGVACRLEQVLDDRLGGAEGIRQSGRSLH